MRYLAIFLILSSLVIYVLRPPGLYDSKKRREASRRYFDAPSETTRKALEKVENEERIEILLSTALSSILLGAGVVLLVRSPKEIRKHAA